MIRSTSRADETRGSVLNAGALREHLLKRKGNISNSDSKIEPVMDYNLFQEFINKALNNEVCK